MKCSNCLKWFQGGFDYTKHLPACNGKDNQCPVCRSWFMTRGQRDQHVTKKHPEVK